MSRLLILALAGLFFTTGAHASAPKATPEAKPSDARLAQQKRMKGCNADAKAKDLKGAERKTFMGECLKKKG